MRKINYGRYSLVDYMRLAYSKLITIAFFRPARLIRQPTRIRGWSNIEVSEGLTTGFMCRIEAFNYGEEKTMFFGKNVRMNDFCHIASVERVVIGNNVLIASGVYISDHDHGDFSDVLARTKPNDRKLVSRPVVIEDDVWIGEKVVILKGVRVGMGAVVGAGSVVTKDVPAYSVVFGNPAKLYRQG